MTKTPQEVQTVLWESEDKECRTVFKQTGTLFAELVEQTWDDDEGCWTQDSNVFLDATSLARLTTLLATGVQPDAT
jgi:hypothetical protein